jgi:TolB protein
MNQQNFLAAVKNGRSFVTNGPLMKFSIGGKEAGDVLNAAAGQSLDWKIEAFATVGVEKVEIVVNGKVAWSGKGFNGKQNYSGQIKVPAGGWVAARIYGGETRPPFADSYPFAHSAPVWLNKIGSRDPASSKAAAADLLRWMAVAEKELNQAYEGVAVENLRKRFSEARKMLLEMSK